MEEPGKMGSGRREIWKEKRWTMKDEDGKGKRIRTAILGEALTRFSFHLHCEVLDSSNIYHQFVEVVPNFDLD